MILAKKSERYLFLLVVTQVIAFFILYFKIRGNYGATLSPIQPDSTRYICKGLLGSGLSDEQVDSQLRKLDEFFGTGELDCIGGPDFYNSRLLLPMLISLVANFNIWWLIFLPTLLFHTISIILWYQMTKSWVLQRNLLGTLIALLPWLSPSILGHSLLVLTEGPLVTFSLIIIYLSISKLRSLPFLSFLVASVGGGLITRQSWVIFAILFCYAIVKRYNLTSYILQFSLFLISLTSFGLFNKFILHDPGYSSALSILDIKILEGIKLGLTHDILNSLRHFDLMGLIVVFILLVYPVFKRNYQEFLLLAGLNFYSLILIGLVYTEEGVYGQNWRYFLPATFISVLFLCNDKIKDNEVPSVLKKKAP